jgi:hypothetical protein
LLELPESVHLLHHLMLTFFQSSKCSLRYSDVNYCLDCASDLPILISDGRCTGKDQDGLICVPVMKLYFLSNHGLALNGLRGNQLLRGQGLLTLCIGDGQKLDAIICWQGPDILPALALFWVMKTPFGLNALQGIDRLTCPR